MMKMGVTHKRASSQNAKNTFLLRTLQLVGGLIIGIIFTWIGTFLWNAHASVGGSLVANLLVWLLLFVFGPGICVAFIVGGGRVHDDLNLVLAQIANVAIYTGLGYVFIRFLEWRSNKTK